MSEHTIRLQTLGRQTSCRTDQSLLDAYLRENVWLPHGCTQGTCGSCKLRVLDGEFDHGDAPAFTLTPEERAQGIALACQATPRSDLLVEPLAEVSDDGVVRHPLRDLTGTVVELADIARETRRVVVELSEAMPFNAGQYAELRVPGTDVWRQYSMANPPSETHRLEFHVRRTPGGIASDGWVFSSLSVGDTVDVRGPLGVFGLCVPQEEPAILIAGGTGLAPMKSIVLNALAEGLVPELYLYHGGRTEADLYDGDLFRALAAEHPNFHYRPCLSEQQWDGACGMVTDVVYEDFPSCKGMSAHLCGPPAMVEAAGKVLKRRRMAPRLVFKEEFTDAADLAAASAPLATVS
jgi:NAD(P)H-flavin reductase/ferredoxin